MGKMIAFYHPVTRPKPDKPEEPLPEEPSIPAIQVLRELSERDDILDVVVLVQHKDGQASVVSTLDGVAEILLFMEMAKADMIDKLRPPDSGGEKTPA